MMVQLLHSSIMVPIGILTKDRVAYLDVTLRSLSATDLPDDVSVTIYDDGSTAPTAGEYYYSTNTRSVSIQPPWPNDVVWRAASLDIINRTWHVPFGIVQKVHITRSLASVGVVRASMDAIEDLLRRYPDAPGVFLLQDDAVFNRDWYTRMLQTVDEINKHRPVGVLAGIKLNSAFKHGATTGKFIESGITAQCLYVSRQGFEVCRVPLGDTNKTRMRFDDQLRRLVHEHGMWAGCVMPFVCQHFGIVSQVRPNKPWLSSQRGRIGYYSNPPYVIAAAVRNFRGA